MDGQPQTIRFIGKLIVIFITHKTRCGSLYKGRYEHIATEHVLELVVTNKMQKMQLEFLMVERVQSTKIKHSVAYFCAHNHEFPEK